jgi:hypothetical protein
VKDAGSSVKINKVKENDADVSGTKVTYSATLSDGTVNNLKGLVLATTTTFGTPNDDGMGLGTITINGVVKFDAYKFTDGTVTVANKSTIAVGSEVNVGGTLALKNESADQLTVTGGEGTIEANNTKLWKPEPTGGLEIKSLTDFEGLVDTSSISKVARMEKDISSSTIEINQTFELFGNTTISKAECQGNPDRRRGSYSYSRQGCNDHNGQPQHLWY